jgi:hypothetical protein
MFYLIPTRRLHEENPRYNGYMRFSKVQLNAPVLLTKVGSAHAFDGASLGSIVLAHAAIDAAVAEWPQERFKLQNGIMLMREHLKRPDK